MLDNAPVPLMRESVDREVGNMAGNVGRVMAVHHLAVMVPNLLVMYAEPGPIVVTVYPTMVYRIGCPAILIRRGVFAAFLAG